MLLFIHFYENRTAVKSLAAFFFFSVQYGDSGLGASRHDFEPGKLN